MEVANVIRCSVVKMWVKDVGADSWGRGGLGPGYAGSWTRRNILSNGGSLWSLSIGLLSVVVGSFRKEWKSSRGRPVWA